MTCFVNISMACLRAERWWRRILRCILGVVLIYAAYRKISEPWIVFAAAIDAYGLLPGSWAIWTARTLPWFEAVLGLALLAGVYLRPVAIGTAGLLGGFFGVMVYSYATGKVIDCGCFGSGDVLGPTTLLRDGVLLAIALALVVLTFRADRQRRTA